MEDNPMAPSAKGQWEVTNTPEGVVLQATPAYLEDLGEHTQIRLAFVPRTLQEPAHFSFFGTFALIQATPRVWLERGNSSSGDFSGEMDTPRWIEASYRFDFHPPRGVCRVLNGKGDQVAFLAEKAGAELALRLAKSLPGSTFRTLNWPDDIDALIKAWDKTVGANAHVYTKLKNIVTACEEFVRRMIARNTLRADVAEVEALRFSVEHLFWASKIGADVVLEDIINRLNTFVGNFVDTSLLPADHESTTWFVDYWHLPARASNALLRSHISPALAALLQEDELLMLVAHFGSTSALDVIISRDIYFSLHPSAFLDPSDD
jgi:hypothetical protein